MSQRLGRENTLPADEEPVSKLDGNCAVQALEWKELRGLRDEELVTIRDINEWINDCVELIPEWLNFVKGVVDSEERPLNISRETLQYKILRVIKMNFAQRYLEMLAKITEQKDDYNMFYEQFVECVKFEIAELLRSNTFKPGDQRINFEECVDRMKKRQNDIYGIAGKNFAVMSSSLFRENLCKRGYEVLYVADPVDGYAAHHFKEFDGTKQKPTMKGELDLGDHDERNKLEELNIEFKPLKRLMREVLGDKVETVIASDSIVGSPCVPTTSEFGWSANMQRSTQQSNSSQQQDNQPQVARQSTRQERRRERNKERNREGERGRSEQEEERDQEGRKEEERKVAGKRK